MVDGERMIGGKYYLFILAPGAKVSNGCKKVLSKHLLSNVLHFIFFSLSHFYTSLAHTP
jgi:hypothetical protein